MKPERRFSGRTVEVYYYLLTHQSPLGVRELQRAMGFSSPSGVAHHLEKLIDAGLVERNDEGKYSVKRTVEIGALRSFFLVRGRVVPRQVFYLVFFSFWLVEYLEYTGARVDPVALLALLAAAIAFGYETARTWKKGVL